MPLRTRQTQPMRPYKGGLLVARWKHGTLYYHVPTEAHLHAAALNVLQFHNENNYYAGLKYDKEREENREWGPKHPGMEPEEIEKRPAGPIREAARKSWKEWVGHKAGLEQCNDEWKIIEYALKNEDGVAAWDILQERRDHEYERVEIESMEGEDLVLLPQPKKPAHGQRWTDAEGQRWIYDSKKGKGLGWIYAAHAQWRSIYAAHETGETHPEITQYDLHWVVREAWSHLYDAYRDGQTAGATEELPTSPKDFKEAIEDLVEFADHPDQSMLLVTDPAEALKTGEAVLRGRHRRTKFTCTVKADAAIKPHVSREDRKRAKKKTAKKKTAKKK